MPTEPVTATILALVRDRAALPNAFRPSITSFTINSGAFLSTFVGTCETNAAAAPFAKACATNSCPSRRSVRAIKRSPGIIVLVSIEIPSAFHATEQDPLVALIASDEVHNGISMLPQERQPLCWLVLHHQKVGYHYPQFDHFHALFLL